MMKLSLYLCDPSMKWLTSYKLRSDSVFVLLWYDLFNHEGYWYSAVSSADSDHRREKVKKALVWHRWPVADMTVWYCGEKPDWLSSCSSYSLYWNQWRILCQWNASRVWRRLFLADAHSWLLSVWLNAIVSLCMTLHYFISNDSHSPSWYGMWSVASGCVSVFSMKWHYLKSCLEARS